jgi:hypothetical protein
MAILWACMYVLPFLLLNQLNVFQEPWYERNAIGGTLNAVLPNFLQSVLMKRARAKF